MTDDELIARMRSTGCAWSVTEAADRIEALIAERDEARAWLKTAGEEVVRVKDRAEPLPCPFCGGPARTYYYNGTTQAVCCAAKYVDCAGTTCDAPVAMWNRRATPETKP